MSDYVQVITTAERQEEAEAIARALVEQRLAACVQIVGPIRSVYRWQGKVETAQEWQCLIKTRQDRFDQVQGVIRRMHAYQVPEILALPVVAGSEDYLRWVEEQVRATQ